MLAKDEHPDAWAADRPRLQHALVFAPVLTARLDTVAHLRQLRVLLRCHFDSADWHRRNAGAHHAMWLSASIPHLCHYEGPSHALCTPLRGNLVSQKIFRRSLLCMLLWLPVLSVIMVGEG